MKNLHKTLSAIGVILIAMPLLISIAPSQASLAAVSIPGVQSPSDVPNTYLPMVLKVKPPPPLLLGLYPPGPMGPNDQAYIDAQIKAADTWAGKRHSIVATFVDLEDANPTYNVYGMLEILWNNGYTTFINLNSTKTAYQIANGVIDVKIRAIGTAYANWIALGGGRKAFFGPLPEMNGYWPSYGQDIPNFKLAYDRIRNLFAEQGAPINSAWWVFVPNGYTNNANKFENYYPGDSKVDMIGFSSYNYGYCAAAGQYKKWEDYTTLYLPYLDRMRIMAPSKPIFIAQTGSSAQYPQTGVYDHAKKDQWLIDTYTYLASRYGVMGILYFDLHPSWECDWAIFNTTPKFDGYITAVANPSFEYVSPAVLSTLDLTIP